jgi:septum formation protein
MIGRMRDALIGSHRVVLASASPRRAELLRAAGIEFDVRVTDVDESVVAGESPGEYVTRLAIDKARAAQRDEYEVILAADTTVVVDAAILAKPIDAADAARMLRLLAGRDHDVLTGVCLMRGVHADARVAQTRVTFEPMNEAEIAWYVATGEPMDKAGAYGIQGRVSRFVSGIDGSYSNVVGLPVSLVYQMLRDLDSPRPGY